MERKKLTKEIKNHKAQINHQNVPCNV